MLLNSLTFHSPTTIKEAAGLMTELDSAKVLAGGSFLLNSLKILKAKGAKTPKHIIGLNKVSGLKGIEINHEKCIIHAMTTIDDIFLFDFPADLKFLNTVCRNISTQPIRNMATIGGNLTCRYTWTEMPAVMVALGAELHFIDANGKETVRSAEEFFLKQAKSDGLFTHVSLKRDKNIRTSYQRIRKSASVDIPLLSLMIVAKINDSIFEDVRIGVNNCVQFAQRDKKLEEYLIKDKADRATIKEALNHMDASIYEARGSDFKSHIFRVAIKNALEDIIDNE